MAQNDEKFTWDIKKEIAAEWLAEGYTIKEASKAAGISTRTIDRLKKIPEFASEVDKLTCMTGIASRAERLRISKRVIRKRMATKTFTKKDVLEWLKYAQSETDGIKLGFADQIAEILAAISQDGTPVPGGRSEGDHPAVGDPDKHTG
jgi:hypothetical protein